MECLRCGHIECICWKYFTAEYYLEWRSESHHPFRICIAGGECIAEVKAKRPDIAADLLACLNERKSA